LNITIRTIPDNKLSSLQKSHLELARRIAEKVPVYPANITNSVRIIGAYKVHSGPIYIDPERLKRLSTTVNTTIHEKAHHISQADDGTIAHDKAISEISHQLAKDVSEGKIDKYLADVVW
jgi:hypothetical protein